MSRAGGKFNMIQSWGVASARHTSATLVHNHHDNRSLHDDDVNLSGNNSSTEYLLDVPMGPSIVCWDIRSGKRCLSFQAHSDVVTCMRLSPGGQYVATSSFSGEVKLWDGQWRCLDKVEAPMGSQHHLAWSQDSKRFIIVGNGTNSSIVMYNIISSTNDRGSPINTLQQAWQVRAGQTRTRVPPSKPSGAESAVEYFYNDAFFMGEVMPSGKVLAVEERPGESTLMELFSREGTLIKTVPLKSDKKGDERVKTLFMSGFKSGCYAIGVQGGRVLMVGEDLQIQSTIRVGITARTCVWDGECLVLPTDSGQLVWWTMRGEKVKEVKVGSPDTMVRLDWSVSGQSLWMCGFSALRLLSVKREQDGAVTGVTTSHVISSHEIACCGVAFSPSGWRIVSGDLAGNIWVTEGTTVNSIFKCNVGGSVRCMVWRCEDVILVGGLDGQLSECKVGGACKPLLHFDGSVTHMGFDHSCKLLAVGTSKGMLEVYSCSQEGLKVVTKVLAHPPRQGPQDKRFGQLTKQAEVWSLCWSPTDDRLATCSEDQTTKVWDTSSWKCLATLTGHSLAVTSVDWKDVGGQSLIASCADDRTVRLTDGGSYELLRILDTKDIYGWHTLTYLSFHPAEDSPLLLCTTQNGHVVVWNSLTAQRVTRGKMHLGSIEGLAWRDTPSNEGREVTVGADCDEGKVVTVGADCVVNLFTLKLN